MQDPMLERIADSTGQAVVAVEYRAAPEHPYPARPDDCEAAAAWLVQNGKKEFGTDVLTIGGESAGGHLTAVTILRMRDRHAYTGFRGSNIVYGAFDLSMTPSQRLYGNTRLVLRTIDMQQFYNAFAPVKDMQRHIVAGAPIGELRAGGNIDVDLPGYRREGFEIVLLIDQYPRQPVAAMDVAGGADA